MAFFLRQLTDLGMLNVLKHLGQSRRHDLMQINE